MPIYKEYLNENANRYYPFVNANAVPTGLILDICLLGSSDLPNNANHSTDATYISRLVTDGTQLRVYLATKIGANTLDLGCATIAGTSTSTTIAGTVCLRTEVCFTADHDDKHIVAQGYLITGDLSELLPSMPASIDLDENTGRLYPNCILTMTKWIPGIVVNGKTLTGLITLVAGPGIQFDVSGNTVTVSCIGASLPPENTAIVSDASLLSTITTAYGLPITQINGQGITNGGNWTIAVNKDGGLAVDTNPGQHTISITNLYADVCCSSDQIATLVDNISALNDRVMTIQSFQTQLETGVNILSTQLARLT